MGKEFNRKDFLYKKAKDEGYRSRASYKLIELHKKYSIFKQGHKVMDLGCYPGGWIQVASNLIGPDGLIIGIDIKEVEPFELNKNKPSNIHIFKADLFEIDKISNIISEISVKFFDIIMSDMSPPLTGIKDKDQIGSLETFNLAIKYAYNFLKPNTGTFLCKVFPSQDFEEIFKNEKKNWSSLQKTALKSSRTSSNELYVIGKGHNKTN